MLIALSYVHVLIQQFCNSGHVALNYECYIYRALFYLFTRILYHVGLHFYRIFIKILSVFKCGLTQTINPLKTERRLLYVKNQLVLHSKHFSSKL